MARRNLSKRLWYDFLHVTCRLFYTAIYRVRCEGRHQPPRTGPLLVLSNHQSHFDPVLIGLACDRRLNYLARQTLFGFPPFRWLINSLDAIPIDRDGMGLAGLKETMRRLKDEEAVLIFPEGTRTPDGELATLKPGFSTLVKRVKAPVAIVAIDGAFQAWPKARPFPVRDVIQIEFGETLSPEECAAYSDRDLVDEVERRLRDCLALAREKRLRRMSKRVTTSGPSSP